MFDHCYITRYQKNFALATSFAGGGRVFSAPKWSGPRGPTKTQIKSWGFSNSKQTFYFPWLANQEQNLQQRTRRVSVLRGQITGWRPANPAQEIPPADEPRALRAALRVAAAGQSPPSAGQVSVGGSRRGEERPLGTAEGRGLHSPQQTCCCLETERCVSAPPDTKHNKLRAARSLVADSPRASDVWFLFEQAIF